MSQHNPINNNPIDDPISEITFRPNPIDWAIKIRGDGITFNHVRYPDSGPGDFANLFIAMLEKQYDVTFTKRKDL